MQDQKERVNLTLPSEFIRICRERQVNISGIIKKVYEQGGFKKWIGNGSELDREKWLKKGLNYLLKEGNIPTEILKGRKIESTVRDHWASVLGLEWTQILQLVKDYNRGIDLDGLYEEYFNGGVKNGF